MAKGVRKLTGFLWALLIAILSFFIIFIFFPDVSNRFFGVSIRGEDVQKAFKSVESTVNDKVSEAVDKAVDKVVDSGRESVADALSRSGIPAN